MSHGKRTLLFLIAALTAQGKAWALGERAGGPFPDSPVQIIVIENGEMMRSDGRTVVEASLADLQRRFGVRITQKALAGYILNLDQAAGEFSPEQGFDLYARVLHPFFAPWFHRAFPEAPGSAQYFDQMLRYAQDGKKFEGHEVTNEAVAWLHIDHVYFPARKFASSYYLNILHPERSTNAGFESALHEALHVWHGRRSQEVDALMHSKGSYFDKRSASQSICPEFTQIISDPRNEPICGFANEFEAAMKVLSDVRWPQRYGRLTNRRSAPVKNDYGCASGTREEIHDGRILCVGPRRSDEMGDLHAFDNEFEYFAILMQLYKLSPEDFERVASPEEKVFARRLFESDFK